jgi:hypothetical protein
MRSLLNGGQALFFGLFIFTLSITILQATGHADGISKFNNRKPVYNGVEEYDASLNRLTSLNQLENYTDSLFTAKCGMNKADGDYVELMNSVIRKRFYHGYSYYGLDNNYLAFIFSKFTKQGYSAIVLPNDILKNSFASCSQQSIVMMEALRAKGFKTRKIGFYGKKYGGHFCFEVFYNREWHFFDPNLEPDVHILDAYNRPGIAFLNAHQDILLLAYRKRSTEMVKDIFPNYSYGSVNTFPAPTGMMFQKATKFLSNTIWLFFLLNFLLFRRLSRRLSRLKHVWNSRIYFPQSQRGSSSSYYPGLTAPGT